jgi:hypothetical protein
MAPLKPKKGRSMRYKALIALLAIAFACQSSNIFARGGRYYGPERRVENVKWYKVKAWDGRRWIMAYVPAKDNPGHGFTPHAAQPPGNGNGNGNGEPPPEPEYGRPPWTPEVVPGQGRVDPHKPFKRRREFPGHPHYTNRTTTRRILALV